MRKCSLPRPHLWGAILIAMGIPGIASAALTGDLLTNLSYYSTFEDPEKGIAAELPEENPGAWNTTGGNAPSFITVSGEHRALNLASYNAWTSNQAVLSVEDEAFTIAFTAKTGTSANGILFAFGDGHGNGGLSFRRDETPGSLAVCTGLNVERLLSAPEDGSDVAYHHYALVQNNDGLTLYVDGEAIEDPVEPSGAVIIDSKFQWRSRYGRTLDGEAYGSGAIDALGVWKRALTANEIKAVAAEMAPLRFTPAPVSFDVPEGWTTKPAPEQAVQYSLSEDLALEQNAIFRQTLGGRVANVANITGTGSNGTTYNVYGISSSSAGDKSVLERDVWLKVSGGAHALIVGGKDNYWLYSHANAINGDLVTELSGSGVTAKSVIGGIYGCSDGGGSDPRVGLPLTGNTLVTIGAGSKVTGNIIGSSVPMHGLPFTHTGNTWVRVLALQNVTNTDHTINGSPAGYVVGASMRADGNNRETSGNLTGSATVEVTLTEGSGVFEKTILGGSFNNSANADSTYTISGNTSVIINAPGVTFPRAIYAAGQGKNVTVQGKASVTLKGGTFTGALGVGIEGATANDSELVIDGGESGIDLSQATVAEDFKALTLKSNLNLGANRLPNATFTMEGEQTLSIAVTAEEIATRRVVLGRTESVPEGLTIAPSGLPEGEASWVLVEIGGVLYYGASSTDREWATPSAGSAWSDGLLGFQAGDNVAFGANLAQEEVTFTNDIRVGTMTVSGNYTFAGRHTLSADRLTINKAATLMLSAGTAKGRYIRLLLLTRATSGNNCDGIALAEMKLMLAEQEVAWNGATVTATQAAENSSHKDDHLIDGNLSTKWYWTTGSTAFDNCSLTLDAGEGNTFTFDAYRLAMADQNGRNPTSWELAVSDDGVNWKTVDKRSYATSEVNAWTPNAWIKTSFGVTAQPTISSLSPISVAGAIGGLGRLEGSVTFEEGSTLLASPNGALTLSGPVSGTVEIVLPEDAEQWQNALDFPVLWMPKTEAFTLRWTPSNTGYELMWRDGCYRLRRRFSAELSQDATTDWFAAGWKDMNNVTPTSEEWQSFTGETDFTITARGDLTVNVPSEGYHVDRFAVTESEHLLTLSGGKLTPNALTVEGKLAATSSTLAIPSGATTINEGGTLTYDVPSDSVEMSAMEGTGTFVKTGAGTLTLTSGVNVEPQIIVRGGTLSLLSGSTWGTVYPNLPNIVVEADAIVYLPSSSGSVASTEATITLRNGGIFRFTNGNAYSSRPIACAFHVENDGVTPASFQGSYYGNATTFTGRISGHGRVVFEQGDSNGYSLACPISDDGQGTLSVRFADTNSAITVSGASTYTGGTEIASAVTASNAEAFGRGPLMIASGATLTVASNTTLNVYDALSGQGTVSGAVQLVEGASLDASVGVLTVATLSVAESVTVPVTLPEALPEDGKLLAWTAGPETADAFAVENLPSTARLVAKADGLYYEFLTLAEGAQATFEGLSEAAQRQLAAVAFTAGATSVAGISGATAKRSLTTAEIDAALLCFGGVLTTTVSESAATLTVTYDFGIADMAYDREAGVLTITAKVQGAEGAQTATFVAGSTVELLAEDEVVATVAIGETETSEIQLPVSKEATAALLETPRPLKVRVKK